MIIIIENVQTATGNMSLSIMFVLCCLLLVVKKKVLSQVYVVPHCLELFSPCLQSNQKGTSSIKKSFQSHVSHCDASAGHLLIITLKAFCVGFIRPRNLPEVLEYSGHLQQGSRWDLSWSPCFKKKKKKPFLCVVLLIKVAEDLGSLGF